MAVEVTVNVRVRPLVVEPALVAVARRVPVGPPLRNSTVPAAGAVEPAAAVTLALNVTGLPKLAVVGLTVMVPVLVATGASVTVKVWVASGLTPFETVIVNV